MVRADQLLVERGLAKDLKQAQALILAAQVVADDERVEKAGDLYKQDVHIRVKVKKFVSRGGDKLHAALLANGLSDIFQNAFVLDIGASTGGFTDCALLFGAREVVALDVGSQQLHQRLKNDKRVIEVSNTHIKDFDPETFLPFDIILADISFNSLTRLLPWILSCIRKVPTYLILLMKPQFELPAQDIPAGGVVKDPKAHERAKKDLESTLDACDLGGGAWITTAVKGTKGNQEYFYYVKATVLPSK